MKTIERLRELEKAATAGPWYIDTHNCPDIVRATGGGGVLCGSYHDANVGTANVELAKATRNALPALLAVVEAQAAEIAAWREVDVAASAVMKIMRIHGGGALVEEMKEVAMQKKDIVRGTRIATDAALRALEGGAS